MTQDVLPEDANTTGVDEITKIKLENEKLQEQLATMQSKFAEKPNTKESEYSKAVGEVEYKKDLDNIATQLNMQAKERNFLLDSIKAKLGDSDNSIDLSILKSIENEKTEGHSREEIIDRLKFWYIHTFLRDESFDGDDDLSIPLKKVLETRQYIPSISKEVSKLYLSAKGIANKALRAKNVSIHEKQLGKIDNNSDLDMRNPVHVHLAFSRGKIKGEDYDLFRKNLKQRG